MNNNKLGKMKDELCKTTKDSTIINTIIEVFSLEAQAYCYTSVREEKEKI